MSFYQLERLPVSPATALAALRSPHRAPTRDPRAAPLELHKNVSIVETCRFYGVADALTSCRVPRSCQDCLAMPGCAISFDGLCENVSVPWMVYHANADYHTALASAGPHGPAFNRTLTKDDPGYVFFAENATYCEPSDEICSSCRTEFRALARSKRTVEMVRSQFCVGANGCVCVAVCEVPELLAWRNRDVECGTAAPAIPTVDPPALPSFSTRRRDPRSLPTEPMTTRRVDATCGYYDELDLRGCRAPRSCQDCLKREGCMISGYKCIDAALYGPSLDFRNPLGKTHPSVMFPATNTTYCAQDDATCTACRAEFEAKRKTWVSSTDPSQYDDNGTFCVGTSGCVCIELCENTAFFREKAKDTECLHTDKRKINGGHQFILGFLAFIAALAHLGMWSRDRRPRRSRRTDHPTRTHLWRHMLDEAPQALQLDLFGWRRYHQELQEKELELLTGAQDVSPVARPVGFDNTSPTAPDLDEDKSSAPPVSLPTAVASAPVYGLSDQISS